MNNIAILGTGTFASSLAYQLSLNNNNQIVLFGRRQDQINEICESRTNKKYFPHLIFHKNVSASTEVYLLEKFSVIFLVVPSSSIQELGFIFNSVIDKNTLIVIMSKGLVDGNTIHQYLSTEHSLKNIVSLKGPSFSSEMVYNHPTLLTLGYERFDQIELIKDLLQNTNLYLDYTHDIKGVEYLSALKNIYAIFMGYSDAIHNSYNTRYFLLTQCFNEIKILLKHLNCNPETLTLGCGLGDLSLTSLSDLSRNRTLGLMIGKGFFNRDNIVKSVVLEGLKTLEFLNDKLDSKIVVTLPILNTLFEYFIFKNRDNLTIDFPSLLNRDVKTVLTYGTFDLFHYGHFEILKRAKSFGDRLIVGLSSDEFNLQKGKVCEFTYEKRKKYLESLEYVDLVIPEHNWDQKIEDVKKYNVDYFVMGDDWKGKFDFLHEYCEVIYLPRTEGISTTQMKQILKGSKEN